jgi:hypothetical protein
LAVLAKIGTESENAVSAFLPFQCLGGTENGRASCPAGNAEYFGVSLMLCAMPCLSVAILGASWVLGTSKYRLPGDLRDAKRKRGFRFAPIFKCFGT